MFINTKLVDTKHAYQREAKGNLKELKALMEKLVVKETPIDDSVFNQPRQAVVPGHTKKKRRLVHLSCRFQLV